MNYCDKFEQNYSSWQEGRLSGEEIAEMERHRAQCPHCATFDPKTARLRESLASLPELQAPVGFEFRLQRRIKGAAKGRRYGLKRKSVPAWTAVGARFASGV